MCLFETGLTVLDVVCYIDVITITLCAEVVYISIGMGQ